MKMPATPKKSNYPSKPSGVKSPSIPKKAVVNKNVKHKKTVD